MSRFRPAVIAPLAFTAALAACGSEAGPPAAEASGDDVSCTADPRLDTYDGELDKAGERGVLSFRFFELDPAPPARGLNTFHLQVTGDVMPDELDVDLRMPDHGHGTSITPIISADAAPGTYTIRQLFLFMPGVWRLDFEALGGEGGAPSMLDSVALHFCVEG